MSQDFWDNIGVVIMDLRGEVDQVPVVLCEEPQARPGKVLKGRKLDGHVANMKLKLRDVSIGMSHGTPVRRPARCRSAHSTTMTDAWSPCKQESRLWKMCGRTLGEGDVHNSMELIVAAFPPGSFRSGELTCKLDTLAWYRKHWLDFFFCVGANTSLCC